MNYVLFVSDPDNIFTGPGQAGEEIHDALSRIGPQGKRARLVVSVDSESRRIEELEDMVSHGIDEWDEAQRLAKQTIEDAQYWGVTMLASFKELADHLGVELKEE